MFARCKKIFLILVSVLFLLNFSINYVSADMNNVYLGGFTAGFTLDSRGAEIIGLTDVLTENGIKSPSKDAGLAVGDIILSLDGKTVNSSIDVEESIKSVDEAEIIFERNGITHKGTIKPEKDAMNINRIGVFIRDSIKGIGTVTYIKNGRFGALGHPVLTERGEILAVTGGQMYKCSITGIIKGEKGRPGELRGAFEQNSVIADVSINKPCGVFGNINDEFCLDDLIEVETGVGTMGDAKIYSNLSGEFKFYDISIIKVDKDNKTNKNYVIKVTDRELLELTGGIVQGMSGSPIVQNGILVGAVTHVFINDPFRGFGIMIDNM